MRGMAWLGSSYKAIFCLLALMAASCGPNTVPEPEQRGGVSDRVTVGDIVPAMLQQLGGEEALRAAQSLVMEGEGTRKHLGQIPMLGAPEPLGYLTEVTEIIDLANGQAAFDNQVKVGEEGYPQGRTEVLLYHEGTLMSWATTSGRPHHVTSVDGIFSWATHNSPAWLLRRNPVTIALAALDADPETVPMGTVIDGNLVWVVSTHLGEETIDLYIDQNDQLLRGWHSLDTESMVGDTNAVYNLSDYRSVGDLMLPHVLRITKADGVYLDMRYEQIRVNDDVSEWFVIPEDVRDQAEAVLAAEGAWVNLEWDQVSDTVAHIVAFSHHSMVVEFPDFVAVVEAPYTQAQSLTLARMVEERLGKPVRYVAPTHTHYDHTGGLRAMASLGATVLTAEGHEDEIRLIVESPHSYPQDRLAEQRAAEAQVGEVESFRESHEISGGDQVLQLFEVSGIPHMEPMVIAYVPSDKVLFQSDLFFGAPGPDAQALYTAVLRLALDVETIIGGHSRAMPFSSLAEVVGN